MKLCRLLVVMLLLAPWCLAQAQAPAGVAGVEVVLAAAGAEPRVVVTDASGAFVFGGVAAGPATLRFSAGLPAIHSYAVSWTVEDTSAPADARKAKDPKGTKALRAEELAQGVAFDLESGTPAEHAINLNSSKSNVSRTPEAPARTSNLNLSKSNVNRSAGPAAGGPLTVRGTVTAAAAPAPPAD